MKRRIAGLLAALFVLALMLPGCGAGGTAEQGVDFEIIVATDLHYLAPTLTDHGAYFQTVMSSGDGKLTEYCDEITDAFFSQVIREKPDALILTGDLSFNGERDSHLALAEKLARVEEAGVPVLVLPGNHDLYRNSAAAFFGEGYETVPSVTAEEFREIYAAFGFDEAISRDGDSLSYAALLENGTLVLMLDADTIHDFCGFSEATLDWIRLQLEDAESSGREVLVCCHQNLYRHSMFGAGYVLNRAAELHALLEQYHVSLFLSGHMHIQHIMTEGTVTEIATSALTMGACQYGVLTSTGGSLRYETRAVDMSRWSNEHGRTEEIFSRFPEFAAQNMARRTREQAEEQLKARGYSADEISAMTDYACALNEAYFFGDLTGIPELDPEGRLLDQWESSGTFFGYYFATLREDIGKNYTRWEQ